MVSGNELFFTESQYTDILVNLPTPIKNQEIHVVLLEICSSVLTGSFLFSYSHEIKKLSGFGLEKLENMVEFHPTPSWPK